MRVGFFSGFVGSLFLFLVLASLLVNYPSTFTRTPLIFDNTTDIKFTAQYDVYPEQSFQLKVSSNFTLAVLVQIQKYSNNDIASTESLGNSSEEIEIVETVINPARISNPLNLSVVINFTKEPFLFERKVASPMLITVTVSYSPSQAYTQDALNTSKFPVFPVIGIEALIAVSISEQSVWEQTGWALFSLFTTGMLSVLVPMLIQKRGFNYHVLENDWIEKVRHPVRSKQSKTSKIMQQRGGESLDQKSDQEPIKQPRVIFAEHSAISSPSINNPKMDNNSSQTPPNWPLTTYKQQKGEWQAILELYRLAGKNRNHVVLILAGTLFFFASKTWKVPDVADLLGHNIPPYYRIEWFSLTYQLGVITIVITIDLIYGMIRKEDFKVLWSYPLDRQRLFITSYLVVSVVSLVAISLYVLGIVLVGDLLLYGIKVNWPQVAMLLGTHALAVILILGLLYTGYAVFIDWPRSYFLLLTGIIVVWIFGNMGESLMAESILVINPISRKMAGIKLFISCVAYIMPFVVKKRLEMVNIV